LKGHVKLKVTKLAGANAVISGLFFEADNNASFVTTDTTTQGNWKGVYGADGYNIISDAVSYPSYATVSVSGQSAYTWAASTTDTRAPLKAAATTDRLASCWYSSTNFTIDVNLTDGNAHRVAVYALDWNSNNVRTGTIEVLDAGSNAVLDTRSLSSYANGKYLVWELSGHVKLKFTDLSPTGWNEVVSGLFFDPVGGGGSSAAKINWLVTDQLGTPRMIFDQTGSLATTKRHDYLPFGEELFAGTGGRTTAQGYTGDNIRQKFTQKERDNETGLDYFGARYYSSTQGRFTSPDFPLIDQWESNPQSWNLYSYVRNNPLKLVDPTGNAAEVTCDTVCQESKQRAEEERKKAEAEGIDTETIDMVDSGVPRDFGGANLTVAEALQQQAERRENFNRANYFSIIGYGLGQIFRGVAGIFRSGSSTTTVAVPNSTAEPLGWGSWGSYPKVIEGGKEYAEIGGRLYTYHVVERMMPRGLTTLGRSVSPTFVEEVIQTGTQSQKFVDGVLRTAHTSGSVSVITEDGGRIVVTVITQ
jgi:RHS repeat-associated protein